MTLKKSRTLRLNLQQERDLEALSKKLNIDETNVIRLAITRLAEEELPNRSSRARS